MRECEFQKNTTKQEHKLIKREKHATKASTCKEAPRRDRRGPAVLRAYRRSLFQGFAGAIAHMYGDETEEKKERHREFM